MFKKKEDANDTITLLEAMGKFESVLVDLVVGFPRRFDPSWKFLGISDKLTTLEKTLARARKIKKNGISYDVTDALKEVLADTALYSLYALALINDMEAESGETEVEVEFEEEDDDDDGDEEAV